MSQTAEPQLHYISNDAFVADVQMLARQVEQGD